MRNPLGDFSQCTAFFTEINNDAYTILEIVNASAGVKNESPSVFTFLGGSYTFSIAYVRYGLQVQIFEPKTLEPLPVGEKCEIFSKRNVQCQYGQ